MVRSYKRKSNRCTGYSQDDVEVALALIRRGNMTTRRASAVYGIPYSTLNCYVTGRRKQKSQTLGRPPALPIEDERNLADYLKILEKWGFGLSRNEVFHAVQRFVINSKLQTPFKNGRPSEDWFLAFKQRHKLSIKKPQSVEYARKKMTDPFYINEYFQLLQKTLEKLDLFDKPHLIWNLDETSTCTDPSKTKVVGEKGKPSSRITGGSGKENVTWLAAASAAGTKAPPLIIFKGLNVWNSWIPNPEDTYPETAYAASPKGWMTSEIFANYFEKSLIPAIGEKRPVLVIYDGHATHVSEKVVSLARSNDITILKLPAHTSHLLQPLDLAVFKSFKTRWDQCLVSWQRKHPGQRIPKKEFSVLLGKVWKELPPTVIANGFRKGGIVPFNSKIIDESMYDPEALKRWKSTISNETNNIDNNPTAVSQNKGVAECETVEESVNSTIPDSSNHQKSPISFQSILLQTIKNSKASEIIKPRKKLAPGAEVITGCKRKESTVKEKKNRKNKKRKKSRPSFDDTSETDSEHLSVPVYMESEDDLDAESFSDLENDPNLTDLQPSTSANHEVLNVAVTPSVHKGEIENISVGKFIIVEFRESKHSKKYVGIIKDIKIENNMKKKLCCSFLRKKMGKDQFFVFPDVKDEAEIYTTDVLEVLRDPREKRGRFYFSCLLSDVS